MYLYRNFYFYYHINTLKKCFDQVSILYEILNNYIISYNCIYNYLYLKSVNSQLP